MLYGAMNFPVVPILEEINSIADLGFDYIEIAMDPPMAHHTILSSQKKEILQILEDNNLGIVFHLPTFVTTADLTKSLRKASVNEMFQSLELAAELGGKKAVLHPSMVSGMGVYVVEEVKGYFYDFLAAVTEYANSENITICLENMMPRNLFGVEPYDFTEIFRLFPSLKLTLDTGHANLSDAGGYRLLDFVKTHSSRIAHLHFSDNSGIRDEHLGIGEGTINFRALVDSLKSCGYNDTLTLEIFDTNRRALIKSRKKIQKLFSS